METDLRSLFVEGMSRASTFVAVLTTDGEAGRFGVTISSLTSVSADGAFPSLLACIHHKTNAAMAVLNNRAFCANLLHEGQRDISDRFAGRSGISGDHSGRFAQTDWAPGPLGQPMIHGATAVFECELATSLLWETHYIMVGQVKTAALSDSPSPLLYGQRTYHRAIHMPQGDSGEN